LTLLDIYVFALPIIGVVFMLAVSRIGSRKLREETARAREAERELRHKPGHATR
jgi:hypothetical protein